MHRAEKVEKAVAVVLAVAEVEAIVVAVVVPLVVVTEIETQKKKFQVDVSFNNWKKDLRAFQEMQKLQCTTKLCISKYQMAR